MKKIKGKDILYTVFPFIPMFTSYRKTFKRVKEDIKGFEFWDSTVGWSIKFYSLTAVIPFVGSIMNIFGHILIPDKMRYGIFEGMWQMWYQFYIAGNFIDIVAWRWQLGLILFTFLFTIMVKYDD